MRPLIIFTMLIALNMGVWMISEEVSAQQVSKSNHSINVESYSLGIRADSTNIGYVLMPGLYHRFRQNNAGHIENESAVYQAAINDPAKRQANVVQLPVGHGYMDEDAIVNNKAHVYEIYPAVDIPIVAAGSIWSIYALSKIYSKTSPTVQEIQGLNKDNIPAFDRWSVYPYNDKLEKLSYYPFYASIPLPFIFFLSTGKTSRDFFRLSFLYWETLSIMGVLGTASTFYVDRYRPYCYTDETSMDRRTSKVARNSFYSGHVEMVAAPTFLIAKVYSDYYPESRIKWVFYGFAATITAATAYTRLRGGDHFPSDIILGAVVGTLSGILVPEFHKNNNSDLSVLPYSNEMAKGFSFIYQF
jgi:membrane-associated phospholipid phosphatase